MRVSASKLRENLYSILDEVLESGVPIEVERKGKLLKIVPFRPESKLHRLRKRDCIVGDSEDLVHMNWLEHWSELQ